jgi:hypothetical protein
LGRTLPDALLLPLGSSRPPDGWPTSSARDQPCRHPSPAFLRSRRLTGNPSIRYNHAATWRSRTSRWASFDSEADDPGRVPR